MSLPKLERISDYVDHWAALHPEREALAGATERLTYAALRDEVDRCAAGMVSAGVERGERVAMLGPPSPASYVTFLAAASIGAIWLGLNPRYTLSELESLLLDGRPRLLLVTADLDAVVEEKLRRLRELLPLRVVASNTPDLGLAEGRDEFLAVDRDGVDADLARARALVDGGDAAAMIYTSGSTGVAKGALVPHRGLVECGIVQGGRWYDGSPRKLCDLPLNHIGGLGDICTSVLVSGGTVYFMERFDPGEALRAIERERLTHVYWIPTQLLAVVESPEWGRRDVSSLQWILWGGAAAPLSLLEALERTGVRLGTSYSLTESTGSVTYTDPDDSLETLSWSIGRIDPHYEVRLADEDGETGERGEIQIRGDFITLGYFGRPEATAAAIDADGWLHTGDVAEMGEGGHLRLIGRNKEMFKSGGYNVYPREVEIALERHPAVALAAVVGVPDERWGEVGHAYVAVSEPTDADSLDRFARTVLANYKVPKRFSIESELPMLPIGKVDKVELRRRASAARQG